MEKHKDFACSCGKDEHFESELHGLTMKTKPVTHTPTPWKLYKGANSTLAPSIGTDFDEIAPMFGSSREDYANAAFIVRAVNAHEELVKISRDLMFSVQRLANGETLYSQLLKDAAKAIAKAEGK